MNIFFLDTDPKRCAKMHNNRHCVKMILEYAQLLSTAHRVLDGHESVGLSESGRKKKVWKLADHDYDNRLYSATHIKFELYLVGKTPERFVCRIYISIWKSP